MRNRIVGYIIIGFALVIGFIILSFNRALAKIVSTACSHGSECPMWGTIAFETNISMGVMGFVLLVGLYLVFSSRYKPALHKHHLRFDNGGSMAPEDLGVDERKVFDSIVDSDGAIFQSALVDKTGMTKVKVTRILDRLEGKKIIERRRRGMTNVVILR